MVQKIQTELFITILQGLKHKLILTLLDISEVSSTIQRLNSYNLLTNKIAEKVLWTIYRPDKKSEKSIGESEMNFPERKILKPLNINSALVSVFVRKKLLNLLTPLIEFTDKQI